MERAKIYLDLAQKSEISIQQSIQRLNDRIKNMLTLASALIPTVATLGYFIAKETLAFWILFPIFFSILSFIIAIAIGIMLFHNSSYFAFSPKATVDNYKDKSKPLRFFINRWASTLCEIAIDNANVANAKFKRINRMNYCIVIGAIIFGFSMLLLAFNLTHLDSYIWKALLDFFGIA